MNAKTDKQISGFSRVCKFCLKSMKKQIIGSNIAYYCKKCGSIRSK